MMRTLGRVLVIVGLLLPVLQMLGGCGHEVVPTSGPHPQVSAAQVKIYPKRPAKYEVVGRIEVPITPQLAWDGRGNANAAFDLLKAKAGAAGANGVLLDLDADDCDYFATAGYHKTFYIVPMRSEPETAVANAIFVIKE